MEVRRVRVLLGGGLLLALGEIGLAQATSGGASGLVPVAAAVAAIAVLRFIAGRGTTPDLAVVVGVIAVAAWIEGLHPGGVTHGKILPGGVALAVLVAERSEAAAGTDAGAAPDVAAGTTAGAAREAGAGVIAAAYVLAGLAKVFGAGAHFLDPTYLGLLLVERSAGAAPLLAEARIAVASSPALCVAFAASALATELGGVCFLWARARVPYAAAVTALHLGIALFMGYVYVGWVLVVWAVALWPSPSNPPPELP